MNHSRRKFIAATSGASVAGITRSTGATTRRENEKQGTTDWQLTRVRINKGNYRTSLIEGYASHQSVFPGDSIAFYVSTEPKRSFTIDLYRMGYYSGTGGRHVKHIGPLPGTKQPTPPIGKLRIRECKWDPALEFQIPEDWASGVYLGKLTTIPESESEPYWQSYIIFVVCSRQPAEVVFQVSDNTWQAYNRWPVNESLYTNPAGAQAPGVAVSFDRPYGKYVQITDNPLSIGSGEFLLWEFPLCYWLEKEGYNVSYVSNSDLINDDVIDGAKVFLSVGHDEYWDTAQYETIRNAISDGLNVLWLCGNSVFIDSPFSPSSAGVANRIIERRGCFGELRQDETDSYARILGALKSTAPDERSIMGVRSVVPFNGGGDWTCRNPNHWVFAGTEMKAGESIPGLVGWEHHGEPDPELDDLEILAEGRVWAGGTREGKYTSVIFPGPKGNLIFNASTIFWSQGLSSPPGHWVPYSHFSRPHGPDPRVQRITRNLLDRILGRIA